MLHPPLVRTEPPLRKFIFAVVLANEPQISWYNRLIRWKNIFVFSSDEWTFTHRAATFGSLVSNVY